MAVGADEADEATGCKGVLDCARVLGEVVSEDGITEFNRLIEKRAVGACVLIGCKGALNRRRVLDDAVGVTGCEGALNRTMVLDDAVGVSGFRGVIEKGVDEATGFEGELCDGSPRSTHFCLSFVKALAAFLLSAIATSIASSLFKSLYFLGFNPMFRICEFIC